SDELQPHPLDPSSSSESLVDKGAPDSAPAARRIRKSSTGKQIATNVEVEGHAQEKEIAPKQLESKAKTRGRPRKVIMPGTSLESSASEEKVSSKGMLSPTLRTRASVLKVDAIKKASEKSSPSRESVRAVATRKRRLEEVNAVETFPASQKPAKVPPSLQGNDGKAIEKPLGDGPPSRVTRRSGPTAPKRQIMDEEMASKTDGEPKKPAVVAKLPKQLDDKTTEEPPSDGPPSRVTRRTGPIAPRKRRIDEGSVVKGKSEAGEPHKEVCTSQEDTDDEQDRLCVAEDEETVEAEQQPMAARDVRGDGEAHSASDDDGEDRLVVDDDEDEPLAADDGMKEAKEATVVEKLHDSGPEDNVQRSSHIQ
ncbi:hypothetical protein OSTOST_03601, partial [Ostertagia ostertagi]